MGAGARLLTLAAVQRELSLSDDQVSQLVRSGALPILRILDVMRVESTALDQLIDTARECGQTQPVPARSVRSLDQSLAARLSATPLTTPRPRTSEQPGEPPTSGERRLTDQQRRVLLLVGQGLPNDEIAAQLSLEVSTVKSHVARLLRRLDLPDRGRLIAHAWRVGLLQP